MTPSELIAAVERAAPEIRVGTDADTADMYVGRCLRWLAAKRYTVTVSVLVGTYNVDVGMFDVDGDYSNICQSDDASLAVALLRCVLTVGGKA